MATGISASTMASHGAQRYEGLLKLVTELQGDLARTVSVCQALRTENDTLKSQMGKVRT